MPDVTVQSVCEALGRSLGELAAGERHIVAVVPIIIISGQVRVEFQAEAEGKIEAP